MIELIRGLLDRPLDPRHARAIVAVAFALTIAFAALVAFGVIAGTRTAPTEARRDGPAGLPSAPPPASTEGSAHRPGDGPSGAPSPRSRPRQDPQDRRGTAAYRRARRAMREHRALQHLPLHRSGLSINLIGADHGRAVLRIAAPTIAAARRGWRDFLRRFADDGAAYEARFQVRARNGITGRRKVARGAERGAARPDGATRAGRRRIRHQHTDRGARSVLTSKPHPKASP